MTGQQLKNSILQLAVQGKLVPQDPNDEPASVLLERIRAEKESLIKAGKIKKEKNPSVIFRGADNLPYEKVGKNDPVCIADEVPFDIPDTWEWVRPTDLGFFSSGRTPKPDELSISGKIPYFKVADMNTKGNETFLIHTNAYLVTDSTSKTFAPNTIVYPKNGGAVFTNKKRILAQQSLVDLNTGTYTPFDGVEIKYIYYLFQTVDFQKYYKGTALPTVDTEAVQNLFWGLPPLREQKRIVAQIELLLPIIEEYDDAEKKANALTQEFPLLLKKSILQEAVQGNLVPQDPNDEPASVLLERIRAEKEQLIKEGKIKKDKHESVIFRRDNSHYEKLGKIEHCIDDDIPFEIPNTWRWERWGNISQSIQYGYNASAKSEGRIKMVRISDIQNNTVIWNTVPYCDIAENEIETYLLKPNDILFARTGGTVGKSYLVDKVEEPSIYAGYLIRTRYSNELSPRYLKYFMETELYWSQLRNGTIATAQPNCNGQTLSKMLLPIPPRHEQIRIVEMLDSLFAACNEL